MPHKIQKPKLEVKVYQSTTGKTISRVALLTDVQRILSPEINEAVINILNRHSVEVVVMPEIDYCDLDHHLGEEKQSSQIFKKNIEVSMKSTLKMV